MPILHARFQAERLSLLFWLRFVMFLVALPILFFIGWPNDATFYVATILTGFIWAYADLSSFRANDEFGSAVITKTIPLNVLVTFCMWMVISPDVLHSYIDHPARGAGIVLSMLAAVVFSMRLQPVSVPRDAFRVLGPVVLMSGLGVVFAKLALEHAGSASVDSAVFAYVGLQSLVMAVIFWVIEGVWQTVPAEVFTGRVAMQSGFFMGLNSIIHMVLKGYAYTMVDNPAYVSVLILTTPLWVMLYYRLVHRQKVGSLAAGLRILIAAALMVYFTVYFMVYF